MSNELRDEIARIIDPEAFGGTRAMPVIPLHLIDGMAESFRKTYARARAEEILAKVARAAKEASCD